MDSLHKHGVCGQDKLPRSLSALFAGAVPRSLFAHLAAPAVLARVVRMRRADLGRCLDLHVCLLVVVMRVIRLLLLVLVRLRQLRSLQSLLQAV